MLYLFLDLRARSAASNALRHQQCHFIGIVHDPRGRAAVTHLHALAVPAFIAERLQIFGGEVRFVHRIGLEIEESRRR